MIPSDARKNLGVKPGDFLLVVSTPGKDGIALIKAEIVKEMIRKMNLGLSEADVGRKRTHGK